MAKTMISCPNCRQSITAELEQLFDVGVDPSAKQRFLSGAINIIQCPFCRFQGIYPTPLVYHDPDKELLITFIPTEISLPRNEQERITGSLINQVVKNLPMEKRKGYLFNPQAALTLQGMVERVLEADGITREMMQAQQDRLGLIQRLLNLSSDETRAETARQEEALIDASFFALLRRVMEAAVMNGDRQAAEELDKVQKVVLENTTFGHTLQEQAKEVEAAVRDLREVGQELTREKLLDLAVKAPSDIYLRTLVNMARPGMDYQFFTLLSERIDKSRSDGRARLVEIREKLLDWTREVDEQLAAHAQQVHELFEEILKEPDITQAMQATLPAVDEFFLQELNTQLQKARQDADLDRLSKLQQMMTVIQEASKANPEIQFIEELLDVPEGPDQRDTWHKMFEENTDLVTPEFLSTMANINSQVQEGADEELAGRMRELNRAALRYSMQRNLKAE